jgi:hypothetical protein
MFSGTFKARDVWDQQSWEELKSSPTRHEHPATSSENFMHRHYERYPLAHNSITNYLCG